MLRNYFRKRTEVSQSVAVIGELNVDLVASGLETAPVLGRETIARDFQIALGSASAIFASAIARLGHSVTFVSKVGSDDFGHYCLEELPKAGISVSHVKVDPASKTGVTIVLSTPQDRALVTCLGAISEFELADVALESLNGHSHLHMTSVFLQQALRPSFPDIFRAAHEKGLTTSFDPNSDPSQSWEPDIWDIIAHTDILFLNETEALQLTRESDVEKALLVLGAKAPCVAIKLGPHGAIGIKKREVVAEAGFHVEAVDTTGAGDTFAAGFVHAFLRGADLRECLKSGNACGALSTLAVGGTAGQPDCEQLTEFLGKHTQERVRPNVARSKS
jgi:sugar/nucleoside kinase (ribokinase family)